MSIITWTLTSRAIKISADEVPKPTPEGIAALRGDVSGFVLGPPPDIPRRYTLAVALIAANGSCLNANQQATALIICSNGL